MKIKIYILVTAVILIGLLILGEMPVKKSVIKVNFNKTQNFLIPLDKCSEVDELLERQWEISYPVSLNKGKNSRILVLLLAPPTGISNKEYQPRSCDSVIEVGIEIPGMSPTPVRRIVSPYKKGSQQQFEWEIQGSGSDLAGTLWINLLFGKENDQISHYPLFAIPLKIRGNSFLGFTPQLVKIILAALILISWLFIFYRSIMKANDII